MFAFGQTLIRLRAPLVADDYSAEPTLRDWSTAAETPIDGLGVDPGGSVETSTVNREQIITRPQLLWQGDGAPDVQASDRFRDATGAVWEVVGHRSDWRHPMTGWVAGSTWPLERVEG